jgi:hypothetical protein
VINSNCMLMYFSCKYEITMKPRTATEMQDGQVSKTQAHCKLHPILSPMRSGGAQAGGSSRVSTYRRSAKWLYAAGGED